MKDVRAMVEESAKSFATWIWGKGKGRELVGWLLLFVRLFIPYSPLFSLVSRVCHLLGFSSSSFPPSRLHALRLFTEGKWFPAQAPKSGVRDTTVTYLADAPDVLGAVLVGEAEVLVEAEAHVVAVEAVGGEPEVQEVLLEGRGHRRLARGREAREPQREALLLAQAVALGAREGRVPGDVAVFISPC